MTGVSGNTKKISAYISIVKQAISSTVCQAQKDVTHCSRILKTAREQDREVMVFGTGADHNLVTHAHVDWLKKAGLRVLDVGIPTFTAFGNDYPHKTELSELLKHRRYKDKDVLMGLQFEGQNPLLEEAFSYNSSQNGTNILITNQDVREANVHCLIQIDAVDASAARDASQVVLHFLGVHQAFDINPHFEDKAAGSFSHYCDLFLRSVEQQGFSLDLLAEITGIIYKKLSSGNSLYAFGNGGSAAFSAYLANGLRRAFLDDPAIYRNIFDLTSFPEPLLDSITAGRYKERVFADILGNLGARKGDVLFGISSSGNSGNIAYPFTVLQNSFRIGLLGFGDGGIIGRNKMCDRAFIIPDEGGFRSYPRAEDGQRLAISAILSALKPEGEFSGQ